MTPSSSPRAIGSGYPFPSRGRSRRSTSPPAPESCHRGVDGGHIDWHWYYGNSPSHKVRCATDPLAFTHSGAPVWRMFTYQDGAKPGRGWIAEREGVASCHYHNGAITMEEFEEHVRWIMKPSQANNWKGEAETRKYQMLATAQQDGYAGRHFDITLDAQEIPIYSRETGTVMTKVARGTKLRLRGPWHGGAPEGYTETSYWVDADAPKYGTWIKTRPWYARGGYFGLYIKPEILLDILATYEPHVPWAITTETWGGKERIHRSPLVPETGLPKGWHVHPDQCPGHDFIISPHATGRDRTHPNDACRFCGIKRRPGWRYISTLTGKPMAPPKRPEPLYFDRFLTPPPPRAPRIPRTWPADVLVPLRKIEVMYG